MNIKETKKKIIEAGQKAVAELIKVAKEPIAPEEIIIGRKSQHGGPEGHPGFCAY